MCTWIVEKATVEGSGRTSDGWFSVRQANVTYDHPCHAPLDHAVLIDFVEDPDRIARRVAVELSAESARALIASIEAALASGEEAHGDESQAGAGTREVAR